MKLSEFLNNTTLPWLLADGGGATKLEPGCAKQTPGNPMTLSLDPGGKPFMDPYWYLKLPPQSFQTAIYDLSVKFPSAKDLAASQAFEFELRDDSISEEEDGGWQADFGTGFWRLYDFKNARWVQTKIGLPNSVVWLAGVNIGAVYSVAEGTTIPDGITFQGLLINGVWNPVGQLEIAVHTSTSPKFNMAVQLDGNQRGAAYSVSVAQADVRIL